MDKMKTYNEAAMQLLRLRQEIDEIILTICKARILSTPKGILHVNIPRNLVKEKLGVLETEAKSVAKFAKIARKCIA